MSADGTLISLLADRLFSAVSGDDSSGRPPLPAFVYDGRTFNPRTWERDVREIEGCEQCECYRVTYDSPDHLLRLAIDFRIYSEYPVLEWSVALSAIGKKDTAEIDAFRSISLETPVSPGGMVDIRRNYGLKQRKDDFQPRGIRLTGRYPDNHLRMDTDDSGASGSWLPYVGVDFDESYGFEMGIGWPGNWSLNIFLDEGNLSLEAGMKRSRFLLHPGEKIKCPSVYIMLRDGISVWEARVLHRRFMRECHSPADADGRKPPLLQTFAVRNGASEKEILDSLGNIAAAGVDALEITSGWNGVSYSGLGGTVFTDSNILKNLGDWDVNAAILPGGLRSISDAASRNGMSTLLWLDVLTANRESKVAVEHPDWFIQHFDGERELLVDLGNRGAREWVIGIANHFLRSEGIDHLVIPTPPDISVYWENGEKSGRTGVAEALYISGWYEFMDSLRRLFPASRIYCSAASFSDFESVSRCIPHCGAQVCRNCGNDFAGANFVRTVNLAEWLPYFAGIGSIMPGSEVSLGGCLSCGGYALEYPAGYIPASGVWSEALSRLRNLFNYDFHLFETDGAVCAYQLHNPENGGGAVAALCTTGGRKGIEIELNQIDPRAKYTVEISPCFKSVEMKGSELEKLSLGFEEHENGMLVFYSRANKRHSR